MAALGETQFQFLKLQNKWHESKNHVQILNNLVHDLHVRYRRAVESNMRSHCYTLHLRLVTAESMLKLYKHYAMQKAKELDALSTRLHAQQVEAEPVPLYDSDSEWD